ncbi:hypothetical protein [Burkholderia diffusa]|uniref:hypothetical protein n=1 Tax=Burkholderia diffusa TaxID=488732 RepID=UPI00075A6911|nr:hypothetical protein [Burkholderia diffusa]KVN06962.1 hypothetical protein WJ62_05785 [Burkholderia diffusa]
MSRQKARGRRVLPKTMLLPMPADQIRRIQLEHHLALAVLRDGHSDLPQLATLINTIYLGFFLEAQDPESYRRAEAALRQCLKRVDLGEQWMVTDDERAAVEHALIRFDAQLITVPKYRYLAALEQLVHFTKSAKGASPIPPATEALAS